MADRRSNAPGRTRRGRAAGRAALAVVLLAGALASGLEGVAPAGAQEPPGITVSRHPGESAPITGRAQAIASSIVRGWPSP